MQSHYDFRIKYQKNHPDELIIGNILEALIEEYDLPDFTNNHLSVIEKGSIPHSHPIITLNTRTFDPYVILKTYMHEQFHWFVHENIPNRNRLFKRLNKFYKNNNNILDDSCVEHIIVCFNTRKLLNKLLIKKYVTGIYKSWQPYKDIESMVEDDYCDIEIILMDGNAVYQ